MRFPIAGNHHGKWQQLVAPALSFLLLFALSSMASAQLTVEKLLEGVVEENEIGPKYRDVETAIQMFQAQDMEGALNAFRRASEANPELPPANVLLAKLLFMANNPQAASQQLESAIKANPNDPEAYIINGDLSLRQGELGAAQLMYERGLNLASSYAGNDKRQQQMTVRALSGLGLVAGARQDWTGAESNLDKWLKIEPDNLIAKERKAAVLFHQNQEQQAYTLFQEVYRQEPSRTRPEVSMARLYDADGKKEQAGKLMALAQDRDAKSANPDLKTQVEVAEWALEAGNLDLAKTAAAAAETIDQDSLESKLIGGLVAMFQGQGDRALSQFEAAHLLSPANSVAMNFLAQLLVERPTEQDRRRALEFAQVNARVYSSYDQRFSREAAITLAWVLHRLGRSQDALRILSQVLERQGSVDSASLYLAARVLHEVQQDEVAKKILDAILSTGKHFVYRDQAQKLRQQLG